MYAPPWVEPGQTKLEDVGPELVNSFAKGVQQNVQAQQVKEQLARLDLAIQEHKDLSNYRTQEIELRRKGLEQAQEARTRGLDLRETTMDRKFDDLNQGREEYKNIMNGLADIDPNDESANQKFWNLIGDNPYGAMSTGGRQAQRNWWQGYNQNARAKGASLRADYNTWASDIKNSLGGGYPVDMSLLLDSKNWKPQMTNDADPTQPGKPTGNVYVSVGNDKTTGNPVYLTRPKSFVDQKVKEYQDFQQRFRHPALQQRSVPSLDVFPENNPDDPNAGSSNAPPIGTTKGGYRFKGGDPAVQGNWEPVS